MNPVIEAVAQSVRETVGDPQLETGHQRFPHVGHAVAIRVLEKPQHRRRGDQHPAVPGRDAGGVAQILGEEGGAIRLAVAIGVLEQANGATDLPIGPHAKRIIAALRHIGTSVGIPAKRHGIHDLWLGRPQCDLEGGINLKLGRIGLRGAHQPGERRQEKKRVEETLTDGVVKS